MSLPDRKLKQTRRPSRIYKEDSIYFETNATHFSLNSRIPVLVLLERFPLVTNSARIVKEMNFRYVFNRGKKIVTSLDKINHVRAGQALFYQCTR